MSSAISGLRAQQVAMDTIGNNISNVNTAGFKASTVNFTDLFYQTLKQGSEAINPAQVGYGSKVGSVDKDMSSTGATTTDNPLDLYVDGEGFFAVNTNANGTGTTYFTRLGNFHVDPTGHLVDSNGNFIMGAKGSGALANLGQPIDLMSSTFHSSTGTAIKIDPSTYKQLSNVQVNSNGTISASLNDQVGLLSADTLDNVTYALTGAQATSNNFTLVPITGKINDTTTSDTLAFNNGSVPANNSLLGMEIYDSTGKGHTISATDIANVSNITLSGGNLTADYAYSDGKFLTGTIVNPNRANLTVALATFVNPNGLYETGNSYYNANISSGDPSYIVAGDGNATNVRSGALEMSNVDLAKEFTSMIVTQRGFQANSRVITVSDSMLQELVDLKRQ
jgi:flagellar hook protein FlgE